MTTKITESVILTLRNGDEIIVGAEEKCRPNNTSVITCDGPRCAVHSGVDTPVTVVLNDERVRTDPTAAPAAFARFIKVQPTPYEKETVEFCGARCVKDWLTYAYVVPVAPCERAAAPIAFPPLAVDGSRFDREPVTQADGLAA